MGMCLPLLLLLAYIGYDVPSSQAASYPVKPVRVIAPSTAGGGIDFVARITGPKLSAALGQPVIIDNRAGAAGLIGIRLAAQAPADGYTLLTATNSFTINPSLHKNVGYDPIKDFEPVTLLTSYMLFVVVHPSLPVRSIKALIELAAGKPGSLNFASAGSGTTTHVAGELFNYMARYG